MSEKIIVPTLGESVTEATVSKWLKSVGENVDSDEPLVELETDKVNVEVPSPLSGVLEKINVKEGQTVEVGALLGSVGSASAESSKKSENEVKEYTPPVTKEKKEEVVLFEQPKKKTKKSLSTNGTKPLILDDIQEEIPLILEDEHSQIDLDKSKPQKQASPSARKLAEEKRIDLGFLSNF